MQTQRPFRRLLALVLILALLGTLAIPGVNAQALNSAAGPDVQTKESESESLNQEEHAANEVVRVSVVLREPGAVDAGFSLDGIGANPDAASYRAELREKQDKLVDKITAATGSRPEVKWHITMAANIVSLNVHYGEISAIEALPEVVRVFLENRYEPQKDVEGDEAEPNTSNSSTYMVGASQAWAEGYTGAGSRIAIIDTGLDLTHQSVNADAFNYAIQQTGKSVSLFTQSDLAAVLTQLNAYIELSTKPTAAQLYHTAKVPYGFNYIDSAYYTQIDHMNDTEGEHGSHVAGIAAANRYLKSGSSYVDAASTVHAVGMAPDAQLFVMKVFGAAGGAYDSDYMVAIEDAITLGCDAVNLSLGSGYPGFSYSEDYQAILNKLADSAQNTKLVVSISAGNSSSFTNRLGDDLYIDDVSMHTGGTPGSLANSLCVASADNLGVTGSPLTFNGNQMVFYTETDSTGAKMVSIPGSFSFVYLDAVGNADDYSTVNSAVSLSGKIVLVNRGSISFADKGNNAISYDPAALVVANNDTGTVSMALSDYTGTFPMVSITLEDAQAIKAASTRHTAGSITYYTGTVTVTAQIISELLSTNPEISSFSSWGIPGSLTMKPEITAPGGNIYSIFGTNQTENGTSGGSDQYENMSGTSMAAPHVAGLIGTFAQYLRETGLSVSGHTTRQLVQSLLMSTAVPMHIGAASGPYYPILQQGAGLVNVSQAIHASSVLFMEQDATASWADGKVKAELGDKPERSGDYSWSFTIHNLASQAQTYDLSTDLFTQDRYVGDDGYARMSPSTAALNWTVSYSTGSTVTVPAGASRTVTVTISIPADMSAFDALYPSGAYVEGYTFVESRSTTKDGAKLDVKHSIPILGFYGSWTDPSMFDNMSYLDTLYGETRTPYSGVSDTNYMTYTTHGSTKKVSGNPYLTETPFPKERLAMNAADYVYSFTYNLLRSAGATGVAVSKLNTAGKITNVLDAKVSATNVTGMWYYTNGASWQNTASKTETVNKTLASYGLAEGDRFRVGFYAIPEYNAMQVNADVTDSGAGRLTVGTFKNLLLRNVLGEGAMIGYDFTVDNKAPEIIGAYRRNNQVTVTARDDRYIACLGLTNSTGKTFYSQTIPAQTAEGQVVVYTFDASGVTDGFYVFAGDYACNETLVQPTELAYTVQAVSGNSSYGSVSVVGYTVIAEPVTGYYVSNVELVSGSATWEIDGNVISVTPSSNCTLRVIFAPKPVVTLRYVANGVEEATESCYLYDTVTLRDSIQTNVSGYQFSGWVASTFAETTETPSYYAPGSAYTVPGSVTLYALYTRHEGPEGVTYELCTALPEELPGNYVISSDATSSGYILLNYNGSYNYNYDALVQIGSSGVSVSGTSMSSVSSDMVFTVQNSSDTGKYNILPYTINGIYLADKSAGMGVNDLDNDSTQWSFVYDNGKFFISSDSYDYMAIGLITSYYSTSVYFSTKRNGDGVSLWREQPAGVDYFTTNPQTSEHTHVMNYVPAAAPSCGAAGHIAYYQCELCGKYFADAAGEQELSAGELVLPATGNHSFGACTSNNDGTHTHSCTVCHTVETEACTYTVTVIEPTETAQGYTLHTCTKCGYNYRDNYTPPIGQQLTVTFLVPAGVASVAPVSCQNGASIALPTAEAPAGYTFLGWVTEVYDNVEQRPSTVLTGSYTPSENITLRALYSYLVGGDGNTAFELVTAAQSDWAGRYVISHKKETSNTFYVVTGLTGGTSYESSSGADGATRFTETGITMDGTTLTGVDEQYVFVIELQDGGYFVKNASQNTYLDWISSTLYASDAYSSHALWTLALNANGNTVLTNPAGGSSWNTLGLNGSGRFAMVRSTDSSVSNMYVWKETASGTPVYTTVIGAQHVHTPGSVVVENNVEPTCTAAGSYDNVVYCTDCGEELSRETVTVAALGHLPGEAVQENYVEPTATEYGGYDTVVYCQRCNAELSREHTVLEPTGTPEPELNEDLSFYTSISIGVEIKTTFTIRQNVLNGYASWYLEVSKLDDQGEPTETKRFGEGQEGAVTNVNNVAWRAVYTDITAKEMGVSFAATLHVFDANGQEYYSSTVTNTVKDYIVGELVKTDNENAVRTLCADILNYGAAAQNYFVYDTDNLVNENLSAAAAAAKNQFETKTQAPATLVNGSNGPNLYGSVSIKNRVVLSITARNLGAEGTVQIQVKKQGSNEVKEILETTKVGSVYSAKFSNVEANEMRDMFEFTALVDGVETGTPLLWSVEGYVRAARLNSDTSAEELALLNALLIYTDSAAAAMS